jgi:tetratricopeptide (TPR) repeat protein
MQQSQRARQAGADRDHADKRRPTEGATPLERAEALLREGQPQKALDLLTRAGPPTPRLTNAVGVCLLRLGEAERAVDVFRGLVLLPGTICLRRDAAPEHKSNFAAALLAAGNVAGGLRALDEVGDEDRPAVRRLRDAVRRWREGLFFRQRLRWYLGGGPPHAVPLDSDFGEL